MILGDIAKDTDIPTVSEGLFFTSTFLKILWLISQSVFYAVRPTLMRPKDLRRIDIANILIIIFTNAMCVYFFGPRSIVYILGSSILGKVNVMPRNATTLFILNNSLYYMRVSVTMQTPRVGFPFILDVSHLTVG